MGCILTMIDSLLGFIRRNPLTTLLIVILAVGAPSLLQGVLAFILYSVVGIILVGLVLSFVLRWRILKMQRQMEEQFSQGAGGYGHSRGFGGAGRRTTQRSNEGEVRIHMTDDTPEKRVAEDVGDYVDFEETPR